jgi:DNA gyrase subunit B
VHRWSTRFSVSSWPRSTAPDPPAVVPEPHRRHFDDKGGFKAGHELRKIKRIARRRPAPHPVRPDFDIFEPEASLDLEHVRERVATMCFLVPGLKIVLVDKRPGATGEPEEFVSRGGLADYVDYLSVGEPVTEVITLTGLDTFEEKVPVDGKMAIVERECRIDVALRWVKGYDSTIVSFVNTIPTSMGGTHVAGFEQALTRAVNDVLLAGTKKLAKFAKDGDDRAQKGDVQEGLVAAVKAVPRAPVPRPDQAGAQHTGSALHRATSSSKASPTGFRRQQEDPRQRHRDKILRSSTASPRQHSRPSARRPRRLHRHARQIRRCRARPRQRAHHRRGRSQPARPRPGRNSEF